MLRTPAPPRRGFSRQELLAQLRQRSTTVERVRGLLQLITVSQVAQATGVSVSTVRNWSTGKGEPRPDAALALDDLRTVAETLLRGGMDPKQAGSWLISRNPTTQTRPFEEIRELPTVVLAAAVEETLEELVEARESELATAP